MSLPVLGLLAGPTDTSALTPLITALRPWCRPSALDPALTPAAYFASATDAPGLEATLRSGAPTAVFVADGAPVPDLVRSRARVLVVTTEARREELGERAVVVHRDAVRGSEHPPLTPFLRERWRARLGLPDPMVVELGGAGGWPGPADSIPAALAVCSAAVVRGSRLLTALALGTAVVTDATSAAAIGATEHVHLAVAPPATAREVADALASDPARAAALGWGGRLLVEGRHDLDMIAERIVEDLDLGPASIPAAPLAGLDAELALLGTPASSPVAIRALRRSAGVAGAGDWTDLTGRRR